MFEFENNIHDFIIESDVVICRSGSSTIAELSVLNKPFIAIPLPSSLDNHQYFNASILEKENVAIILDQSKNEIEKAKNYIYSFYENLKYQLTTI